MARSYRNTSRPERRIKTAPHTKAARKEGRITVPSRAVNVSDITNEGEE
jgi:hypothetical protein